MGNNFEINFKFNKTAHAIFDINKLVFLEQILADVYREQYIYLSLQSRQLFSHILMSLRIFQPVILSYRYASVFSQSGAKPGAHDVTVGDDLGDGQWHQIDIERNKFQVEIIIDITRKYLTPEPMQNYLNISVAGLFPSNPRNTSKPPPNPLLPPMSLTGSAFKGCMANVTVNKMNIFKATKESKDIRVLGKLWPKCADDAEYFPPATLTTSTSYIQLDTVHGNYANLNFKFRTFDHTGVLVYYSFGSSTKQALFVELKNGKLTVRYDSQNLNTNIIISPKSYADGLWHNVRLNLTSKGIVIQVNNEALQKLPKSSILKNLLQNGTLIIGTSLKNKPSVKACVKEIQINGKYTYVTSGMSQGVTLDQCCLTDLCFMSPCLNGGVCQQHDNTIQCDCTNTGYTGSRCQNISIAPHHNRLSTLNTLVRSSPTGTARPHQTRSSILSATIKASTTTSKVIKTEPTSNEQTSTVHASRTLRPNERTQESSTGQINQATTTPTQILTGKPKQVIPTTNKRVPSVEANQPTRLNTKQTPTASAREHTVITRLKQATTTDETKQGKIEKTSTVQPKQSITPFTTKIPPPSTPLEDQPVPPSTLDTKRTRLLSTHLPTINSTHKVNTRIIIIENSNTKAAFNQNQLLVYLFLFIVFFLFVGLIVIISVKLSNINACPCIRRFLTVNHSMPSQDSIELGHQQRKDSNGAVRVKSDRPSSVNDSGIDRSESGTDSNRSSAEVKDDDICNRDDLETRLGDRGELVSSPDDSNEGFLTFQGDPSLYTQKSFGWTILSSSSNTLRHCRTSTRDLIHAPNENKPRAFIPAYYAANAEFSDDIRLGADDDVGDDVMRTRYRNPTTKYRQLTSSDCSSLENVSIEESPDLEKSAVEDVF